MTRSIPYQSVLLRLIHGTISMLTVLAIGTGFWVYDTYDERWGGLPLPKVGDIQGIHGTIALTLFLIFPLFALYSFHLGDRRLMQDASWGELSKLNQNKGWVALHRLANTVMLLALTLAILSGRMMKEEWLPQGELNHLAYYAHLMAWIVVVIALALHLLLGVKVGGVPLLLSMFRWGKRSHDTPQHWLGAIKVSQSMPLKVIEGIVLAGIILALVVPVLGT
jgi:hypothetical protein